VIEQILDALLDNAIRFSRDRGEVFKLRWPFGHQRPKCALT
jgi:hypothetical protein